MEERFGLIIHHLAIRFTSLLKPLRRINSPLSGSGVVQFLGSRCLSALWALSASRSLESTSALLFMALSSNLRMRPRDRLMKSGLKSSKASWCGGCKAEEWSEQLVWGWTNTPALIAAYAEAVGCMHTVLKCSVEASLIHLLTLEKSFAQPCPNWEELGERRQHDARFTEGKRPDSVKRGKWILFKRSLLLRAGAGDLWLARQMWLFWWLHLARRQTLITVFAGLYRAAENKPHSHQFTSLINTHKNPNLSATCKQLWI